MRRIVSVLTVMAIVAALLAATAVPAFAENTKLPGVQGPPVFSGSPDNGKGARVDHCNALNGGEPGVKLINGNGEVRGNGNCYV